MSELFTLLFLFGFIFYCVFMAKPSLIKKSRKTISMICLPILVVLFVLMGINAPKSVETATIAVEKPLSITEQVKQYDPNILNVRTHGEKVLEIDLKATEVAFSDAGYLDYATRDMKDILIKLLKNNATEKFDMIRFVVIGKLTDQYNKTEESPIFEVEYNFPELRKIQLKDGYIDHRLFLNFANFDTRHPVANQFQEEWCLKDKNALNSGSFCNK